jgi:pentatricopeptide repeat protein
MMRSRDCAQQVKQECMAFVELLKECAQSKDIAKGSRLHTELLLRKDLLHQSPHIATALIHMYATCGSLGRARRVLEELPFRVPCPWNALIAGYARHGRSKEAMDCLERMGKKENGISPDAATFASALKACGSLKDAGKGQGIHGEIIKRGFPWSGRNAAVLGNALLGMYAKCGMLREARIVLRELRVRDVVSWNALISGKWEGGISPDSLLLVGEDSAMAETPPPCDFRHVRDVVSWNAPVSGKGKKESLQIHSFLSEKIQPWPWP